MFKVTAHDGLARCGALVISSSKAPINTPAPMLYTRRGSSFYLTPDMLEKLRPEAQLMQINALQFLNQPTPDVISQFGRSIHHYLGLSSWPIFASNRDPTLTEYLVSKPASDTAAYVTIHSGGLLVTPERYMEGISAMKPDMFVALADEVAADAKPKRNTLSVDRTIKWLDECLQLQQQQQQASPQQKAAVLQQSQQHGSASDQLQDQQQQQQPDAGTSGHVGGGLQAALFAPVVGGASTAERQRSAAAAAQREVAGFALCGFGMGEPFSARPELVSAAVQHLPEEKPRVVVGLDSPEHILMAVQQGVDLFDSSYPHHATCNGYALSFPLTPDQHHHQQQQVASHTAQDIPAAGGTAAAHPKPLGRPLHAAAVDSAPADSAPAESAAKVMQVDAGADDSKINLWAVSYRLDKSPLVPGCSCFTCQNHSRAYIHHLLQTHEMLAGVLLEMHNTHHWLGFFAAVRQAVQQGGLEGYVTWFRQRRARLQQQSVGGAEAAGGA